MSALLSGAVCMQGLCANPLAAQTPRDNTFLDASARQLVEGAMAQRNTVDRSITEYRALSTERMSIGYRVVGRDRLLWRRETASKIHWSRTGPIDIEVVGAREVVPVVAPKAQVPSDLSRFMPHIAFDPMDAELLIRFDTTAIIHPFSAAGQREYQFRTGDSTSITLPGMRKVRLVEVEFIPRRVDPHLIAGSFWLDRDSHGVVQAVFRLARQYEFNRDGEKKDRTPGWVPTMSIDLTYLAVDYGLYDLHWWMPRYVVAEGVAKLGPFGTVPQKYERTYSDYEIVGDTLATRVARDMTILPSCHPPTEINISVRTGDDTMPPDTMKERMDRDRAAENRRARRAKADSTKSDSARAKADSAKAAPRACIKREYRVTQQPDSVLLENEYLPGSIYAGETLLSEGEIDNMAAAIGDLPNVPWVFARPRLAILAGGPGLLRYNRVEGLSLGARGQIDLGRASATGELRYGIADEQLSAELGLQRNATARSYHLGGYRRLVATDPSMHPFSLTSSLSSLLFGVDDAQFFRATGAELIASPATARTQWYNLRVYHEKQTDVDKNTDISLRHAFNNDYRFSPNIQAQVATQSGAALTLRHDFGLDPNRLRAGIDVGATGESGTFDFVKPTATLRFSAPLLRLAAAVEGAAGTSSGSVPTQSLWYLGGVTSLRGYQVGVLSGDSYWRARGEIGTKLPIARVTVFSDMGWAGARDDFAKSRPLTSVGAGFSFMDGIVRFDVAHALRGSKDWRAYLYMGGVL
jgi:hypothetical protein